VIWKDRVFESPPVVPSEGKDPMGAFLNSSSWIAVAALKGIVCLTQWQLDIPGLYSNDACLMED
jgi:hypothetical protein